MGGLVTNKLSANILKTDPARHLEKALGIYGFNSATYDTARGKGNLIDNYKSVFGVKPPEAQKFPEYNFDFPEMPAMPEYTQQPALSSDTEGARDSYATKDSLKQKRSALLKTQGTRGVATLGGKSATLA